MITAEVQVHGYRKGHQLLASSIVLPKDDQAVVDRLSDVAGPLRPKEQFSPYLSAYPLPSGTHYVIARTWQDLEVPRAGCVRTKSILIDAEVWSRKPPLNNILHLLQSEELPNEKDAARSEMEELPEERIPPAHDFNVNELVEALFLEEAKPVVVFEAPNAELIALRLLTALWPDIRRQFSLSTFALSPRKISGRDFNLVFAPSNAKAKFSNWPGRRVDGRSAMPERHRWTNTIARRVFTDPAPRLLSNRDRNLLGDSTVDSASAMRIVLLWEELLDKSDKTPTAVLGLLDIANSGFVSNEIALRVLEPRLTIAAQQAKDCLPPKDAWDFVGALARKMKGYDLPTCRVAVQELVSNLAEREPDGAVSLLRQPDADGAVNELINSISTGLGNAKTKRVEQVLIEAPPEIIARLITQGGALTGRVANDDELIARMGGILANIDQELAERAGMMLLPYLVDDRQFSAAMPILGRLGPQEVAAELGWLGKVNDFQAKRLCTALIERASEVGGLLAVRDVLISSGSSMRQNELLERTIAPTRTDVLWLLNEGRLSKTITASLLVGVLRSANDIEFAELFADQQLGKDMVTLIPGDATDILVRAALLDSLPINTYVRVIQSVIPKVDDARKFEVAQRGLNNCLRNRFDGDEAAVISMLLDTLGARLDGAWTAREGLSHYCDSSVASRNLIVFERAPPAARTKIVGAVDKIALALQGRHDLDLVEAANNACARLMFDAEKTSHAALVDAAGRLMPSLLRARSQPVSLMIAALFPIIYRELAKVDDVPDLLKLFSFFDWNRCKVARHELVDAFMLSSWNAGDLALTACRCGAVLLFLERVSKSYGGKEYLAKLENDLARLNDENRRMVKHAISEIRSDRSQKFDR